MSALNIECWAILSKVRSFISIAGVCWTVETNSLRHNRCKSRVQKMCPLSFLLKMSLRHLVLDKANVSGSIPRSISNLQSLELLRLRHDQITGTFPDNIGQSVDGINCVKISVHPYFGSADSFERTQFAIVAKT